QGSDSLGIAKLGFRVSGLPGAQRADSVLRSAPFAKIDSAVFQLQVPSGTAVGTTFTVEPFGENRDGLRSSGSSISVRVVAAGPDVLAPLVYQTIPARMERNDTLSLTARDLDGLVRIVGY